MRIGWRTDNPPDGYDEYLVQYDSGDFGIADWTDINPIWFSLKTDWHWRKADPYCKVIAWMPLPEPYKAEVFGEDKNVPSKHLSEISGEVEDADN